MNTAMGRLGFVVALGCGWLGGCGDDDGGGSSGVSGGKVLTELSKDDNTKLCRFYEKLYKDSLGSEEQYCTSWGLDGAFDADECEISKQDCLDKGDYEDDLNEDWGCEEGGLLDEEEITGECTATVAEVEACLREDVGRESNLGKKYTCDDVETLSEQEEDEADTLGPACEKVFEKCPDADF